MTVAILQSRLCQRGTYLHVFTYLERPGTPAADSARHVPMPIGKERNRILRELTAAKNLAFRQSMVGRTLSAVTLHDEGVALADNCLKVETTLAREPNRIVDLRVGAVTAAGLRSVGRSILAVV
jgi:threonylcarbamoyladenosine tRNA methylthiotransferase MtaB